MGAPLRAGAAGGFPPWEFQTSPPGLRYRGMAFWWGLKFEPLRECQIERLESFVSHAIEIDEGIPI